MPDIFLRQGEANPNDVRLRDTTVADSAGGSVTATPDTASLTLATFAPTVTTSDHQTATPGVAALTLTAFAPTVTASNHQLVTPGVASLVLATFAPTVTASNHQTATPGVAALTLAPFAPTVTASDHQTVTPATAALTLTGFDPTVSFTANVTATPGTASLALAAFAPSITTGIVVTPGKAALSLTQVGDLRLTATWTATPGVVGVNAIARGTGDLAYYARVFIDSAGLFGFGVDRAVLSIERVDNNAEATLTLVVADLGVTAADLSGDAWSIVFELYGDPASLVLRAWASRNGAAVGFVSAADNYPSIPRSDVTSFTSFISIPPDVSSVERIGLPPTVTASNHQTVTPGTAALTLTGYAPTVTGDAGTSQGVGGGYGRRPAYRSLPAAKPGQKPVRVVPEAASLRLTTYPITVTVNDDDLVLMLVA